MPFNPYDQLIVDEGIRRGYQPHQIAAFLGNRRQESAGNPTGAVGDSGTAYGGFQWRGPRQAALRALGDPSKPETQVAHFYNELEGPESAAGKAIKAATTVDDANRGMKGFLRYGDDSLDTRLNYSQEAMKMLDPNYVPPQGNVQPSGQGQQQQDTSYQDSVMQGGPMALFGQGKQNYDWGNALIGLGASIASINSPTQAAAIAGLKTDPGKDIVSQFDSSTGTWSHYNKRTGQHSTTQQPGWAEEKARAAGILKKAQVDNAGATEKAVGNFRETQRALDEGAQNIDSISEILKIAKDNPEVFGWAGKLKGQLQAGADGFINDDEIKNKVMGVFGGSLSQDQMDALARYQRLRNNIGMMLQKDQKGPQTESDFKRIDLGNFDNLQGLSGKQVVSTLTDLLDQQKRQYDRHYSNYTSDLNRYGVDPRFNNNQVDYYKTRNEELAKKAGDVKVYAPAAPQQPQGGNGGNGQGNRPDPASLAPSLFGGRQPKGPTPQPPGAPPSAPPPQRQNQYGLSPRAARIGEGENATDVFLMPDGTARTATGTLIPKDQVDKARASGLLN
jgi:hypothetical protein